ncbi:MAG: alpha-L-fucosidase [Phycisphaerales bacterium]|nr:alpha-L-fucosidase [Phycisphaerales bacterium]
MNVLLLVSCLSLMPNATYEATWESIDSRPNPEWFADAKFGIFIHWGIYAVPAWGPKDRYAEWYWNHMQKKESPTWKFHMETYGEKFFYQDFAPLFKAELYDPEFWVKLFERAGARYVVLTSKHHDGFSMWPDPHNWNWNCMDIGPHRDLAGELIEAGRKRGLKMGLYYSLYEWFNPVYLSNVRAYVDTYMLPQLKDLVERYRPDIIWPDGEWEHPSDTWRSTEFLAWLFNESSAPKDIVINDRWGKECRSRHGGFATPEYQHRADGPLMDAGRFEECQGMGQSFGYNRNEDAESYRSATQLLHVLIDIVSRGGNLLLNVGPSADGRIPIIMQQRLLDMGAWLEVNGEAIYGTRPLADAPQLENVRFTTKPEALYAICLTWPGESIVLPKVAAGASKVTASLLGYEPSLKARIEGDAVHVDIPCIPIDKMPCQHAYVLKIQW